MNFPFRCTSLLCALTIATAASAAQREWPTRPIRFLTAFAAGGSSDQIARLTAERLTAALGQQIVVDSRPGGNGVLGTSLAAKAPPDGYTFLVVFDAYATNPSLNRQLSYDTLRDFTPVMLFATSPYGLVVHPGAPYRGLADLIAAAKSKPAALTLGSSGVGSRGHLAMLLIEQRAGFKVTQVPYRGPAQIMVDVLGGQITMQMGTFFFVAPFITSQRVRALAVTSAARMPQTPDVPTVAEQGFPGYQVDSWWGIVAPRGVPKPILDRLHAALVAMYTSADVREQLGRLGMTVRASTPEEFDRHIRSEMALWGKVVKESGLSATQ
jgi:tripartite-type tricarboxylate transporter receptor subunit TctC